MDKAYYHHQIASQLSGLASLHKEMMKILPAVYFVKMFSRNRNDFWANGTILGLFSTINGDVLNIGTSGTILGLFSRSALPNF